MLLLKTLRIIVIGIRDSNYCYFFYQNAHLN